MNYREAIFSRFTSGVYKQGYKYTVDIAINRKHTYLWQYETYDDALEAMRESRVNIFENKVRSYKLDPRDGQVVHDNYVLFPTGDLFNLYGKKMSVSQNAQGRQVVHMNNNTYYLDNLMRDTFLYGI